MLLQAGLSEPTRPRAHVPGQATGKLARKQMVLVSGGSQTADQGVTSMAIFTNWNVAWRSSALVLRCISRQLSTCMQS